MRAVIYARYSSDLQSERSIDDQVEVCRRYADLKGWKVVEVFSDRALSGASGHRPGFLGLQEAARENRYDVIVSESLDRLGRRVADISALHDELSFNGIKLHTVATGEVSALLAGILGSVGQQYLLDLKEKTKRGLLGRVLEGRSGGGIAYGYHADPEERGVRSIDPQEASMVERIFREFAAGQSPRAIAKRLNRDGIPGPGGRPWRDTTIRGQRDRGTGLLNNELYIGRLVWNRCSYVKDPRTGKRKARPNPPEQWEVVDVPELRVLENDLWQAVKTRQEKIMRSMARDEVGNALNRTHRRKYLLSGLVRCGECGGGYTIVAQDRYGCANRRSRGTCANGRTIDRSELEERVLGSLQSRMMAPDLIAAFVEAYTQEVNNAARQQACKKDALALEADEVQRKIDGILKAVEDGLYSPAMKERLLSLETRKATLTEELSCAPDVEVSAVIHPNVSKIYERKVRNLVEALNDDTIRVEAAEVLRGLIEKLVIFPRRDDPGCHIEVHGDLATLLAFSEEVPPNAKTRRVGGSLSRISVVAGVGFEPTTFRL